MFTSVSGRQLGGRSYLKMTGHHIRIGFISKYMVVPSFEGLSQTAWSSHRYHLQDLKMSGRTIVTGVISRFRVVPSSQGLSQNTGTSHPRHEILVILCELMILLQTGLFSVKMSRFHLWGAECKPLIHQPANGGHQPSDVAMLGYCLWLRPSSTWSDVDSPYFMFYQRPFVNGSGRIGRGP